MKLYNEFAFSIYIFYQTNYYLIKSIKNDNGPSIILFFHNYKIILILD